MRIPALSLRHLPQVAFWGFLFLLLLYVPLRGIDLWEHVAWGEWILERGELPQEAPALPLSEGMAVTDTAWLSQVVLAATERRGGAEGLSRLFAVTVLLGYLLLARALYLESRSSLVVTLGVLAALALTWGRSTTLSSETFGALGFVVLLWLLVGAAGGTAEEEESATGGGASDRRGLARRLRLWLGVPLVLAVWANLHGSFVYGLAVLACCFAGRAIDVGWRRRSLRAVLDDRAVRRRLYLLELGAAATLLNPYGIDLPLYALGLSPAALPVESQPLVLGGLAGLSFAFSAVALLFVLRHSRRRMPAAHVLVLGFFAAAAAGGAGRLTWYGPIFALVLAPHAGELLSRRRALGPQPEAAARAEGGLRLSTGPDWHYTVIGLTLLAVVFVVSPLSSSLLGRPPRTSGQLLGPEAPLALTAYLTANPPRGLVFNPVQWGGWLAVEGPPGLERFITSEPQVIPRRVLQDYGRVVSAAAEWPRIMERYRIDTVIVDRVQQPTLQALLRLETDWQPVYEDSVSAVYTRVAERHDHAAAAETAAGEPSR